MPPRSSAPPPPLFTPFGTLLLGVFALALLAAGLSTRTFVKRLDLPPPGTFLVIAGAENPLFVKLAQTSLKGLHRAVTFRAELVVPGEAPRPLEVRSQNSTEWEKKLKIPQLTPGAAPADLESPIAVLAQLTVPDEPRLYGRTVSAAFDLDMVVPRLDPRAPKTGQAVPDRVTWTMPLQIQPPGFERIYQRINRIALFTAGGVIVVTILRQLLRRRRA